MNTGEKFGRYEIRRKIGSGGMGEVYLARDTELERDVALKVLPVEFGTDESRMKRFKQEARAVSALNHPNILTIFEIGEVEGRTFIATEFIDGETLRDRLNREEISVLEAVKIVEQIASALGTAHHAHIVHRDIKPENIMIRPDGYVKILDFGLAKPTAHESGTEDKTLQIIKTQAGIVMGSVRYMSPEQARGKAVDERTDIWSVGVCLYEMLSGKNPFEGETISDSLAAVLHVEPEPIDNFIENAPEELNWIVRKTLKKKADERYQNIKDFALDLKEVIYTLEHERGLTMSGRNALKNSTQAIRAVVSGENPTLIHDTTSAEFQKTIHSGSVRTNPSGEAIKKRRNWIFPVVLMVFAACAVAFGAFLYQSATMPPQFDALEITKLSDASTIYAPAISHDGKYIAYINLESGKKTLAVRQLATGSILQIADTPANGNLQFPNFSPDGNYVYYNINESGVGTLYQVPALGGTAKKIVADIDSEAAFSPDGKKLAFARNNAETNVMTLFVANADGTNEEAVATNEQLQVKAFKEIGWSPSNDNLLIGGTEDVFGDDVIKSKLLLVSLSDKSVQPFGTRTWFNVNSIHWTKHGENVLFVAKASEQEPAQIWEANYPDGENSRRLTNDTSGYISMGLARDTGTIIGTKQDIISSVWTQKADGKDLTQIIPENKNFIGTNTILPTADGKIIVSKAGDGKASFHTVSEAGKDEKPLLVEDAIDFQALFSPDRKFIVYSNYRNRIGSVWRMNADGTNQIQLSKPENSFDSRPVVLGDNQTVIFERKQTNLGKSVLMKVPLEGGEAQPLFNENPYTEMLPILSPDGKHFAYAVIVYDRAQNKFNRSTRVLEANGGAIGKLEKQFDSNFGWNYKFSADGKNLTYVNMQKTHNLYNLPIDGSEPKPLTNFTSGIIMNFNWSTDGKRLYIVRGIVNNELVLLKNSTQSR